MTDRPVGWDGEIKAGLPRYCAWCGTDMMPDDDDWITCPNLKDVCIDCCGESH